MYRSNCTRRPNSRMPYSLAQLRKDNPGVSFPRDLVGVDLSKFGVIAERTDVPKPKVEIVSQPDAKPSGESFVLPMIVVQEVPPPRVKISMWAFLYGMREFGLRVQFERYILLLEGHARDYWMTKHDVARSSIYVDHMAKHFGLSVYDLDQIWATANGVDE